MVVDSLISTDEKEILRIYQQAMEFAKIGICRMKLDGTIIFIDRGALQILEIADRYPDTNLLIGEKFEKLFQYIRPKDSVRKEILRNRRVSNSDYPFLTLEGKEKWILHDSSLIEIAETGEKIIQSIFQDITARKKSVRIQNSIYSISEATLNADNLVELFTAIHMIVRQLMPAVNFYIAIFLCNIIKNPHASISGFKY